MPRQPCHDAFNVAQTQRKRHALKSGGYKLREARQQIGRMKETMDEIGDYLRQPYRYRPGQILGQCCTTSDKGPWLKSIPKQVAELLGYVILPAIAALGGDGLSQSDVASEVARATRDATNLLNGCERQHKRLRQGIKDEYGMMKCGYSHVYDLLVSAEVIAETALQLID